MRKPIDFTKIKCKHCEWNSHMLIVLGLIDVFGGRVSSSPLECSSSPTNEHEFVKIGD